MNGSWKEGASGASGAAVEETIGRKFEGDERSDGVLLEKVETKEGTTPDLP